ncbi:MAG: large conductance mechanosensitive channel protein MscL [Thermoanaerobaculia bacterium]
MLKEFREFALRGNVIDLAVAVIIGAAFNRIVASLVDDLILPPIGYLLGGLDFDNLFWTIGPIEYATLAEAKEQAAATINYGVFIGVLIHFIIVAFVIFLLVRTINRLRSAPEVITPTTRSCPFCLTQIPLEATRCAACTSEVAKSRG